VIDVEAFSLINSSVAVELEASTPPSPHRQADPGHPAPTLKFEEATSP
jgi:hypothetical protein